MKLLIKKIYNNPFFLNLRNTMGIRKNPIYFGNLKKNFYISDNFLWRVDNQFITKFIFSDLLNMYYDKLNSIWSGLLTTYSEPQYLVLPFILIGKVPYFNRKLVLKIIKATIIYTIETGKFN